MVLTTGLIPATKQTNKFVDDKCGNFMTTLILRLPESEFKVLFDEMVQRYDRGTIPDHLNADCKKLSSSLHNNLLRAMTFYRLSLILFDKRFKGSYNVYSTTRCCAGQLIQIDAAYYICLYLSRLYSFEWLLLLCRDRVWFYVTLFFSNISVRHLTMNVEA